MACQVSNSWNSFSFGAERVLCRTAFALSYRELFDSKISNEIEWGLTRGLSILLKYQLILIRLRKLKTKYGEN